MSTDFESVLIQVFENDNRGMEKNTCAFYRGWDSTCVTNCPDKNIHRGMKCPWVSKQEQCSLFKKRKDN